MLLYSTHSHILLISTGTILTQCVRVVVFSFLSPDDTMRDEHLHFGKEDPRHNFLVANEEGLLRHIVEHFAPPGGTILDLTGLQGTYCHNTDIQ